MKKINISQVDTVFADGSYPIKFLFFYKKKIQADKLLSALSRLSSSFWPIFGEYENGIIHFDKYEERNHFDEEVIDEEMYLCDEGTDISEEFLRFMPADSKKLFSLKVLQYKNGTLLFPKLNHLAGDGYSYFYFLTAFAMLCKNSLGEAEKIFIPHHDRTILRNFQLDLKVPALQAENNNHSLIVNKIPKSSIRTIIKETSSNFGKAVSTNDILSAMIVKKLTEIRADQFGNEFHLTIPDVHAQSGAIQSGITNAKREIIYNAAHLIPLEQPEAFNAAVMKFLNNVEFFNVLNSQGVTAAVEYFNKKRETSPNIISFEETEMNALGYSFLQNEKIKEAIELFKLNTIAYPNSGNVYDSLGEAYLKDGQKDLAIKNYEKALELNPENQNTKDKLRELNALK